MEDYKQKLRCNQEVKDKVYNAEKSLQKAWDTMLNLIRDDKVRSLIESHCYIAGGAIYSTYNDKLVNDYDIWCDNKVVVGEIIEYLGDNNLDDWVSSNAITIRTENLEIFQFITKWVGEPTEIIRDFDFCHNQFAFIRGKIIPFVGIRYLYTKKLCINFSRARDLSNVMLRIPKMIKKGFEINKVDHLMLLKKILNNAERELVDIKESELHY